MDTILAWMRLFVTGRRLQVVYNGQLSSVCLTQYGEPRRFVSMTTASREWSSQVAGNISHQFWRNALAICLMLQAHHAYVQDTASPGIDVYVDCQLWSSKHVFHKEVEQTSSDLSVGLFTVANPWVQNIIIIWAKFCCMKNYFVSYITITFNKPQSGELNVTLI